MFIMSWKGAKNRRFLLLALAITFSLTVAAQAQESDQPKAVSPPTKHSLKEILADYDKLLMFMYVDVNRTVLVTVTEKIQKGDLPMRRLSIYKAHGKVFEKQYEYTTVDFFVSGHLTMDRSRLITTWGSGSAYSTKIFLVVGPIMKTLLNVGWKREPEFVDIAGDREPEIIIPVISIPGKNPDWAEVYSWDGQVYVKVKKIPWSQRLEITR